MNIKEVFESKTFRGILYGIGLTLGILVVFQLGVMVGYQKASFSYRFGQKYYNAFYGTPRPMMGMERREFDPSHGSAGKIVKISLPTLVIASPEGEEKVVRLNQETALRKFKETIGQNDLREGDFIVVLGSPNQDSEIEAKLIRIMPLPPEEHAKGQNFPNASAQ